MHIEEVEKAIESFRTSLRKSGADLIINRADRDCIELSLIFGKDTCLECIVNSEILLAQAKIILGKVLPQVPKILLHDPRSSRMEEQTR